jgi:hypothetical protein
MTEIDYSKDDFIDINNQLFRRSRNKMGDTSEPIKDMKDEEKAKGELQIYGSELINNLNQINYTFQQIESYIFKPDKTKKGVNGQILVEVEQPNGEVETVVVRPTTIIPVNDIQYGPVRPPLRPLAPEVLKTSEEVIDELPSLSEEGIPPDDFVFYDPAMEFEDDERKQIISIYEKELKRQEDAGKTKNQKMLEDLDAFKFQRDNDEARKAREEDPTQPMTYYGKPATVKLPKPPPPPKPEVSLPKKLGTGKYSSLLNADAGKKDVKKVLDSFVDGGDKSISKKEYNALNAMQIKDYVLNKEKQFSGSGRGKQLTGGAGKKKKAQPKAKAPATTPLNLTETSEVFDPLDEAPKDETQANLTDAQKLDAILVEVSKSSGQKNTVPSYISKIYELITSLIQFIGRTTVLYITRIKKNINYLDEEQVKLIYDAIQPLKDDNIEILKKYKNSALIQTTLTNQLEKETIGLYKEINNSIRNYTKLKNYTTFSGAGRSFGTDFVGGFIEQPNDFVNRTSTTIFL